MSLNVTWTPSTGQTDALNAVNWNCINVNSEGQELLFRSPLKKAMGEKKEKKNELPCFLHKFPLQQRLRGRAFVNCHLRRQPFQLRAAVRLLVRKLQKKSKKKKKCLSTSGVTNSYPKDKKKHTHQHTNNIRCPPLIPLITPTACVCVAVYATACLTFLLTPQTAVICVAPSAQIHFVIRPICVLLYRSVVCVSASAGGRSPFQSTSQWLYHPHAPPSPAILTIRARTSNTGPR